MKSLYHRTLLVLRDGLIEHFGPAAEVMQVAQEFGQVIESRRLRASDSVDRPDLIAQVLHTLA